MKPYGPPAPGQTRSTAPLGRVPRRLQSRLPGRRLGPVLLTLSAACLLLSAAAAPALARSGVYAGIGVGNQRVTDGLPGTRAVPDLPAAPTHELHLGQPEPATALTLNGGFGFNDYLALDLLVSMGRHDTRYTPPSGAAETHPAALSAVALGVRASLPLADVAEVFTRLALGGYELTYRSANVRLADGQSTDDTRITGRGFAAGVGAELFLGHWGLQLGYTVHNARFANVDSLHFGTDLAPPAEVTITTAALLLTYYLQ